jgi:hypothetical protein
MYLIFCCYEKMKRKKKVANLLAVPGISILISRYLKVNKRNVVQVHNHFYLNFLITTKNETRFFFFTDDLSFVSRQCGKT